MTREQDKGHRKACAAGLLLSRDGRLLHVLDQGNWRVVFVDTQTRRVFASVPTGSNPLLIALSPDEKRLYLRTPDSSSTSLSAACGAIRRSKPGCTFLPSGFRRRLHEKVRSRKVIKYRGSEMRIPRMAARFGRMTLRVRSLPS